jgi:hypothetical protein
MAFIIAAVLFISSCFNVSYNFKGFTIPPEVETISIQYFNNTSDYAPASLSQDFTQELRDRFQRETNLILTDGVGDIDFSGEIVDFKSRVTTTEADEFAAGRQNFIIGINVRYTSYIDPEQDFESKFTQSREVDGDMTLADAYEQHGEELLGLIIDDIFNKAFANW